MPRSLSTVLLVPAAALAAAESLQKALYSLNAADGDYAASGLDGGDNPYDATRKALATTLRFIFADHAEPEKVAAYVAEQCIDNGENVRYQITHVIGWTLVLTAADEEPVTVPASDTPYLSAHHTF